MFEIQTSDFGGYRRYSLFSPTLGHGFDVVPAAGANLTAIRFGGTNVLDGFETGDELRSGSFSKSEILFPFPNRLRDGKYSWQGREYTFPLNDVVHGNAIHGFVQHLAFEPLRVVLTKHSAEILLHLEAPGTNPGYPFPFTIDVTYRILDDGFFTFEFIVKNCHHKPIPAGFGWHPYFRLTPRIDDLRLTLPPCERVEIDERMIPTGVRSPYTDFLEERVFGSTVLDTGFHVASEDRIARYSLRGAGQTLVLEAARQSLPYFQIYTPPSRESIALEPMTCSVDALRNGEGLAEIEPGRVWGFEFRLAHRVDPA